jgi:Fe-S-cluster containining protein
MLPTYVRLTGEDWARLGAEAERLAHFIGHRAYMKMTGGHCTALQLRAGDDDGQKFFCSVYEQRPQVCRDLARGSPECLGELATKGVHAGLMT